jgi:assimilatory nitrate reductase catalytic subunit
VICAVSASGLNVIPRRHRVEQRHQWSEAIGKALRAGTNCGSCLPELKRIVHEHAHPV